MNDEIILGDDFCVLNLVGGAGFESSREKGNVRNY
jgi:hypothetical protein